MGRSFDADEDSARPALGVITALKVRALTAILEDVCRRRGVTTYEVCGRARTRGVSYARHELWWRIRNHPDRHYSFAEIAKLFRRDHTTVLQGIKAHQKRMKP